MGSRSPWRLSVITDAFWGFVNFVVLFFQTMFQPDKTKFGNEYSSSDYRPGGGDPPGPPRRRLGRVGGGGGGGGGAPGGGNMPMGGGG